MSPDTTHASPADILVVDDTVENLRLLCGMLKEGGHNVRPVTSGRLALEAARFRPPDIVLLDVSMPEMDGYEVCAEMKADERLKDIPVLFISAHTEIADKVKAFAVGGVDYVTKPFHFDEVRARVHAHLQIRRQQRALGESYSKLRELEQMRDSFVHMLVHDLRSPLSSLVASLEILKEDNVALLSEDSKGDIERCISAAGKMTRMVNSVLDLSKLEAGAFQLRADPCDLGELVRGALGEVERLAEGRPVVFERSPAPLHTIADAELVSRILQNLLANAIQHTPRGSPLHVRLDALDDGARVSVSDRGAGVPEELRERIFEKFAQVSDPTKRRGPSTGLGLAFCKLAVSAHGGCIGVEAREGGGSTFWFTLPKREA